MTAPAGTSSNASSPCWSTSPPAPNAHVAVSEGDAAPTTYRSSFHAISTAGAIDANLAARLAPSAGLRNVLTHGYLDVDLDQLAAAVPLALTDYREYVRQVAAYLQRAAADG